ncbi:hypothetical protein HOBO_244 [Bacillus phage Hobo]|uniref:Uncharacterized protein n=2 Tax=Caeruleovirus BM15 TaxID=1985178 RepID=A0A0S2MUT5_9CAUD|nr:hypothetical protein FD732_gp097 [Bacillus phage BM15]ALO79652.1 hypothetical protein BM10_248 [Bacillus phage BM15]AXQ66999.1 hypothetical protein HOBO_244 [Bacillus phage Hobo]AXQ67856.1 hypothetical protein KIOSHI_239 [Bacillus phage Kioshi]
MSREEKIRWIIEGWDTLGESYTREEVESWDDDKLDHEFKWLDHLLDK